MVEMVPLYDLVVEADAEKDFRFDDQLNITNPVLVVLNRDDVIINHSCYPNSIQLRQTVTPVLAIVSFPPCDKIYGNDGDEFGTSDVKGAEYVDDTWLCEKDDAMFLGYAN